jgi:hypothetical protein
MIYGIKGIKFEIDRRSNEDTDTKILVQRHRTRLWVQRHRHNDKGSDIYN